MMVMVVVVRVVKKGWERGDDVPPITVINERDLM